MNITTLPFIEPRKSKPYMPFGVYARIGQTLTQVGHRTKNLQVAKRRAKVLQINHAEVEIRKMNKVVERLVNEALIEVQEVPKNIKDLFKEVK